MLLTLLFFDMIGWGVTYECACHSRKSVFVFCLRCFFFFSCRLPSPPFFLWCLLPFPQHYIAFPFLSRNATLLHSKTLKQLLKRAKRRLFDRVICELCLVLCFRAPLGFPHPFFFLSCLLSWWIGFGSCKRARRTVPRRRHRLPQPPALRSLSSGRRVI